ncbi:MAG: helix-turn-helix domain-containing protein [Chloroflexota bacterium]|nr:helix-turn-helix domain-containing protein [Chloroflexota bacterium]
MTRKQMQLTDAAAKRPVLVTVADEVRRTGLPRSTVYELAASGVISHARIGRSVYLYAGALDEYIARQTEAARSRLGIK